MDQMAEKIREKEAPASLDERASAGPPEADVTAGALEPAEIKACVGATGGGEGAGSAPRTSSGGFFRISGRRSRLCPPPRPPSISTSSASSIVLRSTTTA